MPSFTIILIVFFTVDCVSVSENNGTALEDIDGDMMMGLGRQLNKPMLTVIGMAIRNLQKQHPCDAWTTWSECGASRVGYISTRKRMRKCVVSKTAANSENVKNETDISICEGVCPVDYNMTTKGFCIKLYLNKKTHDDADIRCKEDDGFLINIDSEKKYEDVKTVLHGVSTSVHIDGWRNNKNSAWKFSYGEQNGFFKWASGQPGSSDTCLVLYAKNDVWYGTNGSSERPFLCEIIGHDL